MTCPSLQQYRGLYSLRGSGPPLFHSYTVHVELCHVSAICTICHKSPCRMLLFFFSFLKGIITHSDIICYPFYIWSGAVYKEPVTRSFQPQLTMYFLRFFSVFCPHPKPIWYLLLHLWQNLSIQQLQLSRDFESKPMAPKTPETSCNDYPLCLFYNSS